MSQKNRTELRKKDFLVVKQTKNQNIVKVITPQNLQVGLDDPEFGRSLTIKGNTIIKGLLLDDSGNSFIKGAGNITVTQDNAGGVTISSAIGTGATLSGGGATKGIKTFSYDGNSSATVEVDLDTVRGGLDFSSAGLQIRPSSCTFALTSVTVNSSDLLAIEDVSSAQQGVKKITVADLMSAASFGSLGNPLTFRDGLTNVSYDNTSAPTIDIQPATNGGITVVGGPGSGGGIRVDPNNAQAASSLDGSNDYVLIHDATANATRKILAQYFADQGSSYSLSAGTGLSYNAGSNYDGGANQTLQIDNSIVPDKGGSNTFTAVNTFTGGLTGSLQEVSSGLPYLVGGTNVQITTGANGQVTITASALGSGGALTNGAAIGALNYDGSSPAAVAVDLTGVSSTTVDRNNFMLVADHTSPSSISRLTIAEAVDAVDRTAIMNAGTGIDIAFAGNANPATISAKLDNNTLTTNGGNIVVSKVPNSLTSGLGVGSFSFDGSSAQAVSLSVRPGSNINFATASDGSLVLNATAGGGGTPGGGDGDRSAQYLVLSATGSLLNERVFTGGTGLTTADGGAGAAFTLSIDNSVTATLSGSQFSGNVGITGSLGVEDNAVFKAGLSGSIQMLSDGVTPYIIGTGSISITTSSSGQLVVSSSAGGLNTVSQAGGGSVDNVTTMVFTSSIVTDDGSGQVTVKPVIGAPSAGCDYSNGLFDTFNYETSIGEAICRINDVLTQLSPIPPPALDNINSDNTGVQTYLSFGSSTPKTGYVSVGNTAGYGTAADINDLYTVATASNNIRIGVFAGETIAGTINSDAVSSSYSPSGIVNFPEFSFGKANEGEIALELNGTIIHTASLTDPTVGAGSPGTGTGTDVNSNSTGFIQLSVTGSGRFNDNTEFIAFQHRTGKWQVGNNDQRNGWNYARVLHIISNVTSSLTNYIEWVRDSNTDPLTAANNKITAVDVGGVKELSGVKYFKSGTLEYRVDVQNAYEAVYDNNNITFTTTNLSIPNIAKPTIGVGEDSSKVLSLTGSATITDETLLNDSVTAAVNVTHPLKSDLAAGGSTTATGFLLYNVADNSTATVETFRGESYRMMSGAFDVQSDITGGSYDWNSSLHMSGSNAGHDDGLLFYNDVLVSPSNALGVLSGDFRDDADGGSLSFAPSGNPDYSGITTGTRTFYRKFQNTTGGSANSYALQFEGSSNIISNSDTLDSNSIKIYTKLPNDGSGNTTGWLDLSTLFTSGTYTDNSGARVYTADSTLDATLYGTFGTYDLANSDHLMVKVLADASWTGNIDQVTATFANSDAAASSNVSAISSADDGIDAKLSFGSTKPVVLFTNVGAGAGVGLAANTNDEYLDGTPNDSRLGIFDLTEAVNGPVNTDTSTTGFADGHTGFLKFEVNGSEIVPARIDLSSFAGSGYPGSGTATSINGNGTGFTNISTAQPKTGSNNYPDFDKWFRTAQFNVATADQRNGWNYARVIHTVGGADRTTNYIEWVNDFYTTAMSYDGITIDNFGGPSIFHLSGVKYFDNTSAPFVSGSIFADVSGSHSNIYYSGGNGCQVDNFTNSSIKAVEFNGTGFVAGSVNGDSTVFLPSLDTAVSDAQSRSLQITASLNCTLSNSLPEDANSSGARLKIRHPQKPDLNSAVQTKSTFLIFSASDSSSVNLQENFSGELYRLQSGTYDAKSDVTSVSNVWDSTADMNSASGHDDGMLIYNGRLYSPKAKGNSGDFRSAGEGGLYQGPNSNVNYSTLSTATRTFYRAFRNDTTSDVPEIRINLTGSAEIIPRSGGFASGSIGTNDFIHIDVKIPGKTAWLDLAKAGDTSNESDGDGCLKGTLHQTINSSGAGILCSFQGTTANGTAGGSIPSNSSDYVVLRIVADEDWTGNLNEINIGW